MNNQFKYFRRTKLHRPHVGRDHLHRQILLNKLDQLIYRPLTLVSAPAGYGKSNLISSWLDINEIPGAWLSLDEQDNDLRQFLFGLLSAVQSIFPEVAQEVHSMVSAPNLPPIKVLANYLINDMDRIDGDFVLVLDDFHVINKTSISEFLQELLLHPPRAMHLIIVGRKDPFLPISALRARDQITEVRIHDLRFTESEVKELLNLTLGGRVEETTAIELAKNTEGWVTGIRLAVLAARSQENSVNEFLKLKGNAAYVMDYLITEILNVQSQTMRHNLLVTSILDRFNSGLCDAISGSVSEQDEGEFDGAEFIVKLNSENLFLIALDTENCWFRYHHLFQNLLKTQLNQKYSSGEVATLHTRASDWFENDGLIDEAIKHALAAGNENRAVQLVEQNRQTMLNSDSWHVFEKWLFQLPDTIIQQHPELMLAQTWVHYFNYRFKLIPQTIDVVESLLSDNPEDKSSYGEIYLFRGAMNYMMGDGFNALKYLERALKLIPRSHHMVRGFADIYYGLAGQMQGQKERVVHVLSGLLVDHSIELPRKIRVLIVLVWIHVISGDLSAASLLNKQLVETATKNNLLPFISWGFYNQGLIHFHRNELDSAIRHFSQATAHEYLMLRRAHVDCKVGLILAYQVKQEKEKADEIFESLFKYVSPLNDPVLQEIVHSCKNRLSLMRGEAIDTSDMRGVNSKKYFGAMALWLEIPVITQCRVLLARGSNNELKEAEMKLLEYLKLNQAHHNTYHTVEVLGLLAIVYEKLGKAEEAVTVLDRAMALARAGGFIFMFLEMGLPLANLFKRLSGKTASKDHIKKILYAFEGIKPEADTEVSALNTISPHTPSAQPLIEPLSNRELEVLELLAQRFQNKEIAENLFISPNTVRTHLQNIYQKLNVNSRQLAIAKAIDLGILSSR